MKKLSILLLCYALISVPLTTSAAIGVRGKDRISPSSAALLAMHPVNSINTKPLDPVTSRYLGNYVMQFKAGSHIMGFKHDRVYLVNTAGFLSVEFIGARGVMPKAATGNAHCEGQGLERLGKVEYQDLWKGITLSYEGVKGGIAESTYRIKPGADIGDIRLKYSAESELQKDGSLKIKLPTDWGWMTESKPVAWQEIGGKRIPVEVAFRIENGQLGFRVGQYDRSRDLIIDPTYQWHTFYGSSTGDDAAYGIAVDTSGDVYVTGQSNAVWNGPDGQNPLNPYSGSGIDIFVLKLNSGGAYQWHTFYGSSTGDDYAYGIAVGSSGDVYVTGESDATWNGPGGASPLNAYSGSAAIFVLKLSGNGAYQWHTFYGSGSGYSYGIAADGSGDVYVTGHGFDTWNGPGDQSPLNAYSGGAAIFVLKLSGNGAYQWHTFYGSGSDYSYGIAADGSGDVYVAGESDATWGGPDGQTPLNVYSGGAAIFVLKLSGSGSYQWHTFYGAGYDAAYGVAADDSGDVYITGQSAAAWNGPGSQSPLNTYSGGTAIFVLKLGSSGAYQWHTFYGSGSDYSYSIAVDGDGDVYVTGPSGDTWNGPGGQGPVNAYSGGDGVDIFVLKLDTSGAYQWHTFYGSGSDYSYGIAADGSGDVYITGESDAAWNGPGGESPLNAYSGSAAIFVLELLDQNSGHVTVPGAPTGVTAVAGNAQATVSFTGPASDGGSPIISYTVTSNPGGTTATGSSSPITVIGLANGTSYTFTVTATNALGTGPVSDPSNSVAPIQAGNPKISVKPTSLNFGSLKTGSMSDPKTITVKNTGKGDLIMNPVTIAGTDTDDFAQTNTCGVISPGGSCTISVTFGPMPPFVKKTATMSISSNDPKKATVNVKLSGKAAPPKISVSPKSINFGTVTIGISTPKTITIKNTGISDLVIGDINIVGTNADEFSQISSCGTIQEGGSCTIDVTFAPVLPGRKSASLGISSNDSKHSVVNVKLRGTGITD